MKKTKQEDFKTKEFKVYFPFDAKAITCVDCGNEPCTCDAEEGKILKITGWANFSGNLEDEASIFVDHCGDVMVPSGFDLKVWNKNPQILWQHDRNYTIGKGIKAVKKSEGLEVTAEIHEKAMEEEDFYKIEKGLVKMLSVGFRTVAGEFKEINGTNVFFITKALLYEVSVVSIPMNSESEFSIVKSIDGNLYAGAFTFPPKDIPANASQNKTLGEDTVKLKIRDLLSADKVKELEDLGMGASLDEPQEVDTKTFITTLVAKEVDAAVAKAVDALKAEITKSAETPAEEESSTEQPTEEETPPAEEEAPTETEEEKAIDAEVFKGFSDMVAKFIPLSEEK